MQDRESLNRPSRFARSVAWSGIAIAFLGVLLSEPIAMSLGAHEPTVWLVWLLKVALLASGVFIFIYFWRSSVNYIRSHDRCVCFQCRYPLRGLPEPGQCPECGRRFASLREVRTEWERTEPFWRP